MQHYQNSILHVICEGKSERNYLGALNRMFRESALEFTLQPFNPFKNAEMAGGHYKRVIESYKKFKKTNRNTEPWLWVDWDLYCRNDRDCGYLYEHRPAGIPPFLFSVYNFEDFLVLHSPRERVLEWVDVCRRHGHLDEPLHSEKYMELFKDFFAEYRKGVLPDTLSMLTAEQVENAISHSLDDAIPFKCHFIETLAGHIVKLFPACGRPWNRALCECVQSDKAQ